MKFNSNKSKLYQWKFVNSVPIYEIELLYIKQEQE
jgi:hypothetical protein